MQPSDGRWRNPAEPSMRRAHQQRSSPTNARGSLRTAAILFRVSERGAVGCGRERCAAKAKAAVSASSADSGASPTAVTRDV
jgi:hypothetical protein